MKRRLSVAVAAMGDPLVCYLDEPSTGMDALHRRQVWSVIQQLRTERLVVLTTHSMEEADVLADTIAIMANGVLKAAGTSLFLKNRYGRGYQLRLISSPEDSMATETLVEKHLSGAEFLATSAGNLNVSLGRHLGPRVARFFRELESGELAQLVTEWEISNTTLEQVFLRLCGLTNNSTLNAGGIEDEYAQQTDPKKFLAVDVCDTLNAVRWAEEDADTRKPVFAADNDVVEVEWSDSQRAILGRVATADADEAQLADKYLGTLRKPLEAVPVGDGRGSLSILLPVNGIPGSKMCVRIPDLRVVTVEVPLDATPGSAMKFIAPSASESGLGPGSGGGSELLQHRTAHITCLGQTAAVVRKSWHIQAKQKKASCCQCCILIFFSLFMFGLAPKPAPPNSPQDDDSLAYNLTVVPWEHLAAIKMAAVEANTLDFNLTTSDWNLTAAAPPVDDPTTATGASAKAVGGSTLIMSLVTTFNLPKLVHGVVDEKQQRLYHSMRLQGLRLWSYWLGFWVWSLATQAFICVPMVLAGYVLGVQVYKHLDIFEYVGILAVWAHSQAGLAAFGGCCFRSAKIATIFFYLLLIGSALAVTIIDQLAFLDDWPAPLLLFPLFSYERSLALMLMGDQAPEGELHKAVLYNLGMGTLLFLLGVILHLIIPNEFGLTESQVLVDLCCRKRKRSGPAARPSSSGSRSLEAPLLPEANDDDNDDAVNDQNLMSEILGDDVEADGVTVDDVAAERHQVLTEPVEDSAVVFKGLQLRYSLGLVEETIRCLGQSLMGWMSSGEQEEESAADGSAYAIRDLTFRIAPAEFFGLLGPSAFRIPPVYHSIGTL
jgi:hypothetical protein